MLILWFLSWIKAGFVRNAAGAGEDLRKLGLGMIGAGLLMSAPNLTQRSE